MKHLESILPFITFFSCSSVNSKFIITEVSENEAVITEIIGNTSLRRSKKFTE